MTKFTIVGDIHIADRPPSARVSTYREEITEKLKWIVDYSNKQDNDALLLLGDVFHIKRPDRNSHSLVTETAEVLGASNSPVVVIPGNHDLCVPTSVEAFTDQGWKTVDELDGSELFATLNTETRHVEWQKATNINHFQYEGVGYKFESEEFDIVTTPNHKWPCTAPTMFEGEKGEIRLRSSEWIFKSPNRSHKTRYLATTSRYTLIDPIGVIEVGKHSIRAIDMAHIGGWFLSTLSKDSHSEDIKIYSSAGMKTRDPNIHIRDILDSYNIKYESPNVYVVNILDEDLNKALGEWFYPDGKAQVPDWIINAGSFLATELLLSYSRGQDYTIRALEGQANMFARTYVGDPYLELAITKILALTGSNMTFTDLEDFEGNKVGTIIDFRRDLDQKIPRPTQVEMNEMVWCPTLPNGTWLCRSNNKVLWTGNSNDDLHSIPSQPLGTLALHPNIELLMGGHSSLPLFSVPYFDPSPENYKHWVKEYHEAGGSDKYPFIGTHQAIFPQKEEPIYDFISAESWAKEFGSKWVAYGHIHSRMKAGPFYKAGKTMFCNNGAISRGSLHEETIHRKLAITDFDSEATVPFVSVPIPYKPAEEVFHLDTIQILKDRLNTVDTFLESLGEAELNYLTVEGIIEDARSRKELSKEAVVELEDIIVKVTTEN